MFEKFIIKYLSATGRIVYFLGLCAFIIGLLVYLFTWESNLDKDTFKMTLILYAVVFTLVWSGICFLFFREKEKKSDNDSIIQ